MGLRAPLHIGLDDWYGADVAVATGWQTVWPLLRLPGVHARAYLVNDDEPAFYPRRSSPSWPARHIGRTSTASPARGGCLSSCASATGRVAAGSTTRWPAYSVRPVERRDDTVVVYARTVTHRRAAALGVLALEELIVNRGRRLRVLMFGDEYPLPDAPFDFEFLGLVRPERLAWTYSEATVGIALSMTNASLVPQDMRACGLPCVELAGGCRRGLLRGLRRGRVRRVRSRCDRRSGRAAAGRSGGAHTAAARRARGHAPTVLATLGRAGRGASPRRAARARPTRVSLLARSPGGVRRRWVVSMMAGSGTPDLSVRFVTFAHTGVSRFARAFCQCNAGAPGLVARRAAHGHAGGTPECPAGARDRP